MRISIKSWVGWLLSALILITVVSCATTPAGAPPSPMQLTDQLGRTVSLDKPPQRIISLAPSNTEIIFALGLGDKVVGVTSYDDYPAEAKDKTSIGGFSTPNIEQIVSLSPDLVLATSIHEKTIIPALEQRGITVLGLNPKTIDGVMDAISMVGKVTGTEKEALKIVTDMQNRRKAIIDRTANLTDAQKPGVLYITWNDPLMTVGADNLDDDIIYRAGGINIAHNLSGSATITLEAVIAANPQVIIAGVGMGSGSDLPFQFAMTEPRLRNTDARLHSRVYTMDMSLAGRAGPRIVDVLERFARCIHPEIFGNPGN